VNYPEQDRIMYVVVKNEDPQLAAEIGDPLVGRLLLFDALSTEFNEVKIERRTDCPVCGDHPTIKELIDYEVFCGIEPTPVDNGNPDEVTVQDMKKALDDPKLGINVVDVRESFEYEIAKVDGVPLLPMSELQSRFTELDPNTQYYLLCKVGARSHSAMEFLREQGFKYVKNVKGGINAWSTEIDRNVPRY